MKHETRNTNISLISRFDQHSITAVFISVSSLLITLPVKAQIQFPVIQPTSKVGEIAKYRTVDLWNNSEQSVSENVLVDIEADYFVTRLTETANPAPRTIRASRSWNFCRSLRNNDKTVCDGALKFPKQLGNKHSYKELPWANGLGHFSASCEVVGEEKVTVPSGTFDTLRINCAGFYQRVFDGNWNGRFNTVTWYAPAIGRVTKIQYFDFNGSSAFNKNQTELVEFIAGK